MPGGIAGAPVGCGSSPSVTHLSRYYGSMLERIGRGWGGDHVHRAAQGPPGPRSGMLRLLSSVRQEHVVDGVRFVPWERMAEYADLNPDVLVTSRWFDPLYWPALAGAKKSALAAGRLLR